MTFILQLEHDLLH